MSTSRRCWPRSPHLADENVPLGRQLYSDELREEIRPRHAADETIAELARKTAIPFGQVKFFSTGGMKPKALKLVTPSCSRLGATSAARRERAARPPRAPSRRPAVIERRRQFP